MFELMLLAQVVAGPQSTLNLRVSSLASVHRQMESLSTNTDVLVSMGPAALPCQLKIRRHNLVVEYREWPAFWLRVGRGNRQSWHYAV